MQGIFLIYSRKVASYYMYDKVQFTFPFQQGAHCNCLVACPLVHLVDGPLCCLLHSLQPPFLYPDIDAQWEVFSSCSVTIKSASCSNVSQPLVHIRNTSSTHTTNSLTDSSSLFLAILHIWHTQPNQNTVKMPATGPLQAKCMS